MKQITAAFSRFSSRDSCSRTRAPIYTKWTATTPQNKRVQPHLRMRLQRGVLSHLKTTQKEVLKLAADLAKESLSHAAREQPSCLSGTTCTRISAPRNCNPASSSKRPPDTSGLQLACSTSVHSTSGQGQSTPSHAKGKLKPTQQNEKKANHAPKALSRAPIQSHTTPLP